jgi:hypothetical protein
MEDETMARSIYGRTCIGASALLLALNAHGADDVSKKSTANSAGRGNAERCIQISRIDHTQVVDDQNIVFHMRGGKAYNNSLPERCIGLKAANAFKYSTSQSQLCNVDIISVWSQSVGEVVPGASCGLGMFEPIEGKKKAHAS